MIEAFYAVIVGVIMFLQVLSYGALVFYVMSWFARVTNPLMRLLSRFMVPLLEPLQRLQNWFLPRMPIDLAPLALILILQMLIFLLRAMTGMLL